MNSNPSELPRLDIDWHYDSSGYYSYIMLRARNRTISDDDVRRVVYKFQEKGIRLPARGKSFRPADNGIQYEYYIRLGVNEEISEINFALIKSALDEIIVFNKNIELTQQDIEVYEAKIKELSDDLLDAIYKSDQISKLLQIEIEKSHSFRNEINKLSPQIAQLESERNQFRLSLHKESESYNEILVSIENDRNKKIEELELKSQEKYEQFQKEISRLEQYQLEIEEFKKKQRNFSDKPNKNEREKEFSKILEILLPNLDIDKGSISFMLHEIRDYKFILKKLLAFNQNPRDVRSKNVVDIPGWREITKVSNGESDKSRIYYQKQNDMGKYEVRVSDKDDQNEDIKKIRFLNI